MTWFLNFCAPVDHLLLWNRRVLVLSLIIQLLIYFIFKCAYETRFNNTRRLEEVSAQPAEEQYSEGDEVDEDEDEDNEEGKKKAAKKNE
jgi:hypothetical protein